MPQHKNIEILLVSHKYPPAVGGMQRQSYELIQNLSSLTMTHSIVYRQQWPRLFFLLLIIPRIAIKIVFHPNIQLIHANDGLMALFLTPFLLFKRLKLTTTIHGLDIVFPFWAYQWWIRHILKRFDLIIAVSEGTRQECLKRGIKGQRVKFIPNGIQATDRTKSPKKLAEPPFVLTSIGRQIPRKGFLWFVQNVLPHLSFPVIYQIAGPGDQNEKLVSLLHKILPSMLFLRLSHLFGLGVESIKLKDRIRAWGSDSNLRILGRMTDQQKQTLLEESDIFIMPNIHVPGDYEGFGLVAQEAILSGKLCLASAVNGIPSAIENGITGILIESENADAWIQELNRLLSDPKRIQKLSEAYESNLRSNLFSWESMARSYHLAFESLFK